MPVRKVQEGIKGDAVMTYYEHYLTVHEECECDAELECDTVCYSIENCPKWEESVCEVYG